MFFTTRRPCLDYFFGGQRPFFVGKPLVETTCLFLRLFWPLLVPSLFQPDPALGGQTGYMCIRNYCFYFLFIVVFGTAHSLV
jgi:hypothetical protein